VRGRAGGRGLAAVDMAVAMKARVLAAASSRKLEHAPSRAEDHGGNYDREDLKSGSAELTAMRPECVLTRAEDSIRAALRGWRAAAHVSPGLRGGKITAIPRNLVRSKTCVYAAGDPPS